MQAHDLSNAFGYLYIEEVDFLQRIAMEMLQEGAICYNLGAGAGTSALAVLEVRPALRDTFTTIDINYDGPLGSLLGERNAFDKAGMIYPNQVLSDSIMAAKFIDDNSVDFLIIDDDHSYDHVVLEISTWLPKMKSTGLILFHDYSAKVWPSVARAVDLFFVVNPSMVVRTYALCSIGDLREDWEDRMRNET